VPELYRVAPGTPSDLHYTLAQTYTLLRADLREGTAKVPDFSHALLRHRLIHAIERAAITGQRQSYL
jgi:hypothetical protein